MTKKVGFDPEYIRDISERVYRERLRQDGGEGSDLRMIEKDGDGGQKLRGRASSYDSLTRAYLKVLGVQPMQPPPNSASSRG